MEKHAVSFRGRNPGGCRASTQVRLLASCKDEQLCDGTDLYLQANLE